MRRLPAMFVILLVSLLFATTPLLLPTRSRAADQPPHPRPARDRSMSEERLDKMRRAFEVEFTDATSRPDYPIEDLYCPPATNADDLVFTATTDTTPPPPPANLTITSESLHCLWATWSRSIDPESGIGYYAYSIGTEAGGSDLWYWQSVGTGTASNPTSEVALGTHPGQEIYISVYAVNGAGLASEIVTAGPEAFAWEDLGDPGNAMTVALADYSFDAGGTRLDSGWELSEAQELQHFISRMLPIITEIYGPPSHPGTVTLVKNGIYAGSNVFFPSTNEVHMATFYPQLLTHELIHAYHDNVILSTDDRWRYHSQLSGFEEGLAQGVSYTCMNRYIELHPDDPVVDPQSLYGSSMDWDYDLHNTSAITSEDFWSDSGGMGLHWARYELAAAAMRKIHLEDESFFRDFNAAYYARLNADHTLTTSRDLVVDLIATLVPEIEGRPAAEWIGAQRVFDCENVPGRKIWVRTQHYPWSEFFIFQRIFYYETFTNGSDWAYWDHDAGAWVYHQLNGSEGIAILSAHDDELLRMSGLLIEPVDNPPVVYQFGHAALGLTTAEDLEPWPGGEPADYQLGMEELGLHALDLTFGETTTRVHRVIGAELRRTTGVFGGVLNGSGGTIYLDHQGFPEEPGLAVENGAFWGTRHWTSVRNPRTGGTDSQPGRVTVRYVDATGQQYVAQRNIDWGSWNGNQLFLFDVDDMAPLPAGTPVATGADPLQGPRLVVTSVCPNPFNPTAEIRYTLGIESWVRVLVCDAQGRRVRTVLSERRPAGSHVARWDGRTDGGRSASSGQYFYRVESGEESVREKVQGKMTLLR